MYNLRDYECTIRMREVRQQATHQFDNNKFMKSKNQESDK